MKVKVLGCSGGIGAGLRTTSLLVDDDILIDAGTGVGDLSMDALITIEHIFITHAHLDHIACIPFLVDTVMGLRATPFTVHATAETLAVLKEHIFNWKVWPDFNVIPNSATPFLQYSEVFLGQASTIGDRKITVLPAHHAVPAVGYQIDSGQHSLVFSGDTTSCDALWKEVNKIDNLKYLLIETSFSNSEIALAKMSKHLCPSMLAHELRQLTMPAEVYITHLKPGEGDMIIQEIAASGIAYTCTTLQIGQEFLL